MSELETRDVQQAMDTIARKTTRRGVLATSTVTGVLAVLRSALGAARSRGYIQFNPAYGVLKIRPARATAVVWTPETHPPVAYDKVAATGGRLGHRRRGEAPGPGRR